MQRRRTSHRPGFTLVELLIVIAIIAILASLGTWAALAALQRGRTYAVANELQQISMAIETFKNDDPPRDYPPDFSNYSATEFYIRANYRRYPTTSPIPAYMGNATTPSNLDPSEALVFWLLLVNVSAEQPFPNPPSVAPLTPLAAQQMVANSTNKRFDFKPDRLIDPDGDGWPSYHPPSTDENTPYVYFRSPYGNPMAMPVVQPPSYPAPGGLLGVARPYRADPPVDVNGQPNYFEPKKYQIICAGLDGHFGADAAGPKQFPSGTYYTYEDEDNITSFSEGGSLGDRRP